MSLHLRLAIVQHFHIANRTLETSRFLQWEDQCTDVIHRVLAGIEVTLLDIQILLQLAVDVEAGGLFVTGNRDGCSLFGIELVIERIQIAVTGKA